jgi:hypothetical protein
METKKGVPISRIIDETDSKLVLLVEFEKEWIRRNVPFLNALAETVSDGETVSMEGRDNQGQARKAGHGHRAG